MGRTKDEKLVYFGKLKVLIESYRTFPPAVWVRQCTS